MRFSDHARVQGKTGHLGRLTRIITVCNWRQGLQCENLAALMRTHRDTAGHRVTIKLLHHILFLLFIHQVTVFNVAF